MCLKNAQSYLARILMGLVAVSFVWWFGTACAGKSEAKSDAEPPTLVRIEEVIALAVSEDGYLYAYVPGGRVFVTLGLDPEAVAPYVETSKSHYEALKERVFLEWVGSTLYVRDREQLKDILLRKN